MGELQDYIIIIVPQDVDFTYTKQIPMLFHLLDNDKNCATLQSQQVNGATMAIQALHLYTCMQYKENIHA